MTHVLHFKHELCFHFKPCWLIFRELLDSLGNLKWPTLTGESIPWATHTPRCKLHGWSFIATADNSSESFSVGDAEQGQGLKNADAHNKTGVSKEDMETLKEDGELPSLLPVATAVNYDAKLTPSKGSEFEHSGRLSLISASIMSPLKNKGKSPSFKRQEDDIDLMLESENEDEPVQLEDLSDLSRQEGPVVVNNAWADYGVKGYTLVLVQKLDNDDRIMMLKAKVRPVTCLHFIITKMLPTYSGIPFFLLRLRLVRNIL